MRHLIFMVCLMFGFSGTQGLPTAAQDGAALLIGEIVYSGSFYTEYFGYAPDIPTIRHYIVVIPIEQADPMARFDPNAIFNGLIINENGDLSMREDRQDWAWALNYIYLAPGAQFEHNIPPGEYAISAAFVAAPISREEAGTGDEAILWPGVTGGGANTMYDVLTLEAGTTTDITFFMTDSNGWG